MHIPVAMIGTVYFYAGKAKYFVSGYGAIETTKEEGERILRAMKDYYYSPKGEFYGGTDYKPNSKRKG